MSARFSVSYFSFCCWCLVFFFALFHLCLCDQKSNEVLCIEDERQALLEFKHNLIDEANRLASWVGEKNDCCRWAGIVCDSISGHVHEIHLRGVDGQCDIEEDAEGSKQRLRGNLSSSLLELKQLKHLDLSCNDFEEIQIPSFIGSLRNLRYLNLSDSIFTGMIPPQLGNLSELRVLSLGNLVGIYSGATITRNMQWLLSLRYLHHLDMSRVDLSKAIDWFQVINTLPSLAELDLSECQLEEIHFHVPSLNLTSLSMLDLSSNFFNTPMPRWIFGLTNLASLDLSYCNFNYPLTGSIYSFRNLTSLEFLHVSGNEFMKSLSVLKGLPSNLISLDISSCGVSSSVLGAIHNLTSLMSLDLSYNQITEAIPSSLGNLCNLRDIDLSSNDFSRITLRQLLQSLFECKSSRLESLSIIASELSGPIPYSIGQLTSLKKLHLYFNKLNDSIPNSIGRLSSLEELFIYGNELSGSLPESIGQLSKLKKLWFSDNMLTGVVTEAHFLKLVSLTYVNGNNNNLTLRVQVAKWIPPFQLQYLYLKCWTLGPQFPLWLQSQRNLIQLDIENTGISSLMPQSFWISFPNLTYLDMSQNHIKGTLTLGIPTSLRILALSSNEFKGELPSLINGLLTPLHLDLSNNFFEGSISHFLCTSGVGKTLFLYLGNNSLSGTIPECWDKWTDLIVLVLENNTFSGELPRTLGSLSKLQWLNMQGNQIAGRIPSSLMNLSYLSILQLGRNKLIGNIPTWFGTKLTLLEVLNLRYNHFEGNIPHELCYLSRTHVLDLAHNNLSGKIPRCFNNFSVLSGKANESYDSLRFSSNKGVGATAIASLVMKGREDIYSTSLELVMLLDLSVNNLSGQIPVELTTLIKIISLNLSANQLIGKIPDNIGDMRALESFDISMNKLSGELPMSLSSLHFLSNFNVSNNRLTGRVPISTQLQSFNESSFSGNNLCGAPLTELCETKVPTNRREHQKEDDGSHEADWGLIISILLGFVVGFWIIVAPLIVKKSWRIAYFCFWSELYDVMRKYFFNMFSK